LFLRLYLPWCFFVAAATSLLLSASVPENLSCNYIERVKILKEAAVRHSTNHYTYPWSAAFPVVGCISGPHSPLTYPPLMLPIRRPVQDDLSSPVPVPKPSTSCKRISGITMALRPTPRALFFDVFGTCVDWRTTVVRELDAQRHESLNAATASLASTVRVRATDMTMDDFGTFAQQWRNSYKRFTRQLAQDATIPWVSVDEHHLQSLRELVSEWKIDGLWTDEQLRKISLIWHHLEPWTDSAMGVALLNRLFCKSFVKV
jgi:hypothetical protein